MAKNKQAMDRYEILDECFRYTKSKLYKEDLRYKIEDGLSRLYGEDYEISSTQVHNDIEHFKKLISKRPDLNLIKCKDGRSVYYRYEDPSKSYFKAGPSDEDKLVISSAISLLASFSGAEQFEWVHEIISNLEMNIEAGKDIIALDSNIRLKGVQFLTPLYEAIINKKVLQIEYSDFSLNTSFTITFHPYYLKEYNNRWFLIGKGFSERNTRDVWPVALDRIKGISTTTKPYQDTDIIWSDYFSDRIGISHDDNVEKTTIVLLFNKAQSPYIATKPIHGTIKEEWEANKLKVSLKLYPNYELESLILSFGERVQIIEPSWLKDKIKKRLLLASKQ